MATGNGGRYLTSGRVRSRATLSEKLWETALCAGHPRLPPTGGGKELLKEVFSFRTTNRVLIATFLLIRSIPTTVFLIQVNTSGDSSTVAIKSALSEEVYCSYIFHVGRYLRRRACK